ncbi:hypothetical protein ACSHT0_06580 [Tepidicaulis sp. LMO-SS28]|uniref:hypothetical protein n=1 Tax=Tepidicaulis sp. LMO-SS28 TaxID=3447455 RepID=UPI003EE19775
MARKTASAQPASGSSSQAAETAPTENQEQAAASASDAEAASAAAPDTETDKQTAKAEKAKAKKTGEKAEKELTAAELVPLLGEMRDLVKGKDGRMRPVQREVTEADILAFRQNGDEVSVVTADGHRHALKLGELA